MKPSPMLAVLLWLGASVGARAAETPSALPRSAPEAQGVSSVVVRRFVEAADAKISTLHSFMLVRHGHVVAEGWWSPQAADQPHVLHSLTKSFTSTAVGLAVAEGKLSVDDPVLKFFPDEAPAEPSAALRALTVRHVLTMSTGHAKKDIDAFPYRSLPFFPAKNLVREFFALPIVDAPGTKFIYDSAGSHLLAEIVRKVTGQKPLEYLRPRLFEPLGIAAPAWEESASGVSFGGFGLRLRTEDVAKFGQLLLQKGEWRGKQLVPAAWIATATTKQVSNGDPAAGDRDNDWGQGYGFQFWMCRHGFFRGDGARGQFCIVMPQHDAVVAITSDTGDMAGVMNVVWEKLVPALKTETLPADAAGEAALVAKLKTLKAK